MVYSYNGIDLKEGALFWSVQKYIYYRVGYKHNKKVYVYDLRPCIVNHIVPRVGKIEVQCTNLCNDSYQIFYYNTAKKDFVSPNKEQDYYIFYNKRKALETYPQAKMDKICNSTNKYYIRKLEKRDILSNIDIWKELFKRG